MVDDATLLAWIDGELPADEAARVAAEVAADPDLQALADAHRALAKRLQTSFDAVLAEPVPDRLLQAVTAPPAATVTDLAAFRAAKAEAAAPPRRWWPQVTALAASLALGLFMGRATLDDAAPGLVVTSPSGLKAGGVLEVALNDQLAASPAAGPVRVALSFRDTQGRVCRSWQAQAQEGIACRSGDGWAVTAALARPPEADGRYRMASGPGVAALVDGMIAGEPFDAAQEAAAKAKGWR
ncbi:anti-sigma factor [Sandarakinorhabdus oryzae]|uniref:hypothetical protein n=1 Tax=Sandarakinorhabdus oryzae TaxID=2675220 RepID=UPI0012E15040|nr:hypothetical protein [Sandarakinorhabdus oryzae]